MKIVSLNAWGGREWAALEPWLCDLEVDVLCLQEVTGAPVISPPWLRYEDAHRRLDQRADLFADVSACLPGFHGQFLPAARGTLDGEGGPYPSDHGNAIWLAPGWRIVEQVTRFLAGGWRSGDWGAPPRPRVVQVARIVAPAGDEIVLGHLHGIHIPGDKSDGPARAAQCAVIEGALDAVARPGDRTVLIGDFNLLPDSRTLARLAGRGLRNLLPEFGIASTRTALYDKAVPWADYALSDGPVRDLRAPADPVLSDHRPLILTL
ncbi:MAG: endonuclease/exonuclease/phosphatase family protein [Shimia sp.]